MTRPIRFLHLTTFYPPYNFGGDGMYVYRLAHALADRGHSVDVVHCTDSYRLFAGQPAAQFPDHHNVTVHRLQSPFGWLSPLLSHQTGRPLLKRAALSRIFDRPLDVVHFHNVSLFGPDVLAMDGSGGTPVKLYTAHEHWLVCPTSVLWKFNERICDRPTCVRCTVAAGRPPQLWRYTGLLSRAANHVDRFLAPSRFAAGMHAARGFTRPFTHLPPFAARRDDDWKRPGPRPHPRPYFLYVGRLEKVKGAAALADLWTRAPDVDLLIVGDGNDRARIDAAALRNSRIVVRGPVAPDDLGPYYAHAIACIVPSVAYEVAPTVVLEAFARKTPIVGRDLGGTSELVREAGGGLLYESDDALLDALARLVSDWSLRDQLGERGYRTFIERWTTEVHVASYLSLVDEVAQQKFGGVPWHDQTSAQP
jgi:glycosyltransferase involved in cell wall biosynthesis